MITISRKTDFLWSLYTGNHCMLSFDLHAHARFHSDLFFSLCNLFSAYMIYASLVMLLVIL